MVDDINFYTSKKLFKKFTTFISSISLVIIFSLLIIGERQHFKKIPDEMLYFSSKQKYYFLENLADMPVDSEDLTPFMAPLPLTLRSIDFLKKHKLSIYSERYYNRNNKDVYSYINPKHSTGCNHDKWVGQHSEFKLRTGDNGTLILQGYYPSEITGNETGEIIIDNVTYKFKIDTTDFTLTYDVPKNKIIDIIDIKINNGLLFPNTNNDERKLSFVLKNMRAE